MTFQMENIMIRVYEYDLYIQYIQSVLYSVHLLQYF